MASIIKVDQIQTAAGGTPTAADLGLNVTGGVLQVVHGVRTSILGTTSTSSIASGITASITPSSSSSKVLISVSLNGVYVDAGQTAAVFELYRGGSSITYLNDVVGYQTATGANNGESATTSYLDSPSSTSALTYEVYMRSHNGNQIYINNYATGDGRSFSTITLMEIAG